MEADDMEGLPALLRSWNVPEDVVQTFMENGIEIKHLKNLNDQLMKELCPKISVRLIIKEKIFDYLDSVDDTLTYSDHISNETAVTESSEGVNLPDLGDVTFENLLKPPRPPFPDFDLKTLLTISPGGQSILAAYDKIGLLNNKHRNRLTDTIVRHLFTRIVNHHITFEEYNIIVGKIIVLFPKENIGTYFVQPIKKRDSISGRPVYARGKLVDKVRNVLYKSGERKRKSKCDVSPTTSKKQNIREDTEEEVSAKIWLQNNIEPWNKAVELWTQTFQNRQTSKSCNVAELIKEWPIFNDPRADALINIDFELKYASKSTKFYSNWGPFFDKIVNFKISNLKEEEKNALQALTLLENEDNKVPGQMILLGHLIPPRGRLTKNIKFSTQEAIDGILIKVTTAGDIENKIAEQKQKAVALKTTVQPYIVYVQGDFENYYLIIDSIKYIFKSAVKAFDMLFKVYHVLHAQYPAASYHLYLLIQRCVYGIKTDYDQVAPYIADLLVNANVSSY